MAELIVFDAFKRRERAEASGNAAQAEGRSFACRACTRLHVIDPAFRPTDEPSPVDDGIDLIDVLA